MINLSHKYQPLWNSDATIFLMRGGRGSGKSVAGTLFANQLSFEKDQNILYTRYTMTSAEKSIIPEFEEKIQWMNDVYSQRGINLRDQFIVKKKEIINKVTGGKIIFSGIKTSSGNQTANLKSLHGITCWVCDEADEIPDFETFDKIRKSIRKKGVKIRIILIMNPSTKAHWIYEEFFEKRGVDSNFSGRKREVQYILTNYLDNKDNLNEEFLNDAQYLKETDPDRYKHIMLGGWLDKAEGVVFTNWRIGKWQNTGITGFGMDFGYAYDPSTLPLVSIDNKNRIVYVKQTLHKKGLKTNQLIGFLAQKNISKNTLIIADSAEGRLIDEISEIGYNIHRCIKGPDSIVRGIDVLRQYTIVVDPSSTDIIKELNNYAWSDKRAGVPIDDWNHELDAIRYFVSWHKYNSNNPRFIKIG